MYRVFPSLAPFIPPKPSLPVPELGFGRGVTVVQALESPTSISVEEMCIPPKSSPPATSSTYK